MIKAVRGTRDLLPPDTALGDNTTGVISSQVNAPRELQFALKLLF